MQRVRSWTLNGMMSGPPDVTPSITKVTPNVKYSDIGQSRNNMQVPPPSEAMVFVHESAITIEDGYFAVRVPEKYWQNAPAALHNGVGTLSFADGHAEFWRFKNPSTRKIPTWDYTPPGTETNDLWRFQQATVKR